MPVSPLATQTTLKRVRIWSSWASSPSELATSTRRRLSPQPTCTWVMASPAARAASSARVSSSSLRALSTVSGGCAVAPAVQPTAGPERHGAHRRAALTGHRGRGAGGGQQPGFAEVGRVGEAGRLAVDDPDPGAA